MISATVALERLRAGNCAFVSDVRGIRTFVVPARRSELVSLQETFAIVLADSRVPVEIIFNQGASRLPSSSGGIRGLSTELLAVIVDLR